MEGGVLPAADAKGASRRAQSNVRLEENRKA
jgi:hypothetical protein